MSLSYWLAFLVAAIVIAVSPGPGAALSMSNGLRHGYRKALRGIGGLQCALVLQVGIVAVGLGAVLTTSVIAFDVVRYLGAAYLVWLGFRKWRAPVEQIETAGQRNGQERLFVEGLLVNLSNPKAIVFVAALVPQFIDPTRPQWPQFLIIVLTMCGVDTIVMSGYALLASHLRRWLSDAQSIRRQNRFFGGLFIVAGLLLAVSGKN